MHISKYAFCGTISFTMSLACTLRCMAYSVVVLCKTRSLHYRRSFDESFHARAQLSQMRALPRVRHGWSQPFFNDNFVSNHTQTDNFHANMFRGNNFWYCRHTYRIPPDTAQKPTLGPAFIRRPRNKTISCITTHI